MVDIGYSARKRDMNRHGGSDKYARYSTWWKRRFNAPAKASSQTVLEAEHQPNRAFRDTRRTNTDVRRFLSSPHSCQAIEF